jgi:hypothetical protein
MVVILMMIVAARSYSQVSLQREGSLPSKLPWDDLKWGQNQSL